jgi:acyl phosphate:glycerol-3-phosphate acyltransferase
MMFYVNYILIIIICYLIGSFPTAYVILRKMHDKDIRTEGTGNVGAMNSYDVSGSKKTGIIVFAIDFLKGLIPAIILAYVFQFPYEYLIFPLLAVVLGHNYSVWLKFKGGRGLSTSAGIVVAINFWLLVIWCVIYYLASLITKNVHISNVLATILLPVSLIFTKNFILKFGYVSGDNTFEMLFVFCSIFCLLILIKHIEPIIDLIKKR